MNLPTAHPLASSWTRLLAVAENELRQAAQPWRLYEFAPAPNQLRSVPALTGPMIYAVPEATDWFYVGQTRQPITTRLRRHLGDPYRARVWPAVMAILLDPDVSALRLDELECAGRDILNPLMGSRWARARSLRP